MLLEERNPFIKARIIGDNVILDIRDEHTHFWSPQLNFRVEVNEENENHSTIAGLIGPRPTVWTMFMFIYFSVGIIGFLLSSVGVSRYILGEYSHFIWGLPVAALFMLTAYQAGKYGEQLGKEQVEILKDFIRSVLNQNQEI